MVPAVRLVAGRCLPWIAGGRLAPERVSGVEMGPAHPAGGASVSYLENIRAIVRRLAEEAGIHDPVSFAHSWHILMKGSIVAAVEGDVDAARRAKSMARLLLERHLA